ncbi:MAG: chloride channel protein [Anaerolineae bacterium]|nr:chloride channel protein [Anaerolineae bacterium]
MSDELNLRSKVYWRRLGWGVSLGLFAAIGALVFNTIVDRSIDLVWPNPPGWEPFSGSWNIVIIMAVAGLIVGLIHKYSSAKQLDVFEAVNNGYLDPAPVPASLAVSLVSLIGGFSLGPEVPIGMLATGLASWVSKWRKLDVETTRTNVIGAVSSAYAGLFSSPFALLMMILESSHMQTVLYYGTLLISGLAAAIGFSLFFWVGGDTFSSLLGIVQPPSYDLNVWHIGAGIVFGIIAVPLAIIFLLITRLLGRLVAPLNSRPVIRGVVGGILLGLLGKALPLTLFLGTAGLSTTTSQAAEIGATLLIVYALAKMLALGGALSFGFIGGPIFPMLFIGGTLGAAVNVLFPQIPPALAIGCLIVAIPAAVVPIPLALAVIGILIVGLSPTNTVPVIMAALVSFAVAHGLGLYAAKGKAQTDAI